MKLKDILNEVHPGKFSQDKDNLKGKNVVKVSARIQRKAEKLFDKQFGKRATKLSILHYGFKNPKDKKEFIDTLQKMGASQRDLQLSEDKNPCWDGYKQVGMKTKNGKQVPNCVKESVNEAKLKPKKLTQLKRGEKFVFNNTPYEFIELYPSIKSAAKVKTQDGKTSVVSFGGGVVNKNTKGGFSDYLDKGGRIWDNVNIGDESVVNENNIISKLNKVKSELSPLSSLYIQSIIDDKGVIEDINNTGSFVTIEDIKLWNLPKYGNRLTLTYRFYNKKFEHGGFQTIASFYGDIDEILSNIEHLIFDVVRLKKKKFKDIEIDFKINNRVAKKWTYANRFNEALRESVNEAKKFTVKKLSPNREFNYYPYGLYYDNKLVVGLKSNSKKEFEDGIKKYKLHLKKLGKKLGENESVNEANAVSGGKIHKFITGKNLTYKGKKYSDIEFELLGIDNKDKLVKLKILAPRNLFGHEMKVPFRTIRRGPFIKTDTSK